VVFSVTGLAVAAVVFSVTGQQMRTAAEWGFKYNPAQWLAATQIKSWLSARWSEQKAAAKKGGGAIEAFLAQEATAVAAAAGAGKGKGKGSGAESGEGEESGSEAEGSGCSSCSESE
jgi:hypothetical protein